MAAAQPRQEEEAANSDVLLSWLSLHAKGGDPESSRQSRLVKRYGRPNGSGPHGTAGGSKRSGQQGKGAPAVVGRPLPPLSFVRRVRGGVIPQAERVSFVEEAQRAAARGSPSDRLSAVALVHESLVPQVSTTSPSFSSWHLTPTTTSTAHEFTRLVPLRGPPPAMAVWPHSAAASFGASHRR